MVITKMGEAVIAGIGCYCCFWLVVAVDGYCWCFYCRYCRFCLSLFLITQMGEVGCCSRYCCWFLFMIMVIRRWGRLAVLLLLLMVFGDHGDKEDGGG